VRVSRVVVPAAVCAILVFAAASGQNKEKPVSFKKDIFPIIQKNCLPCHAEDNFNPSELSLDDYERMSAGGKNGPLWTSGNAEESNLVLKLKEAPPFGDRMPLNSKRKVAEGKAKWLTPAEVATIATWINQGAKDN
jgi:hypothetical protein